MKNFLLKSFAILILIGSTLPLFAASTPAANDGKWYYVKSQRFNTGGPWWTFDTTGKFVVPGALTMANNQKFTLVEIGTTGKVTVKDHSGLLLNATTGSGVVFDAIGAVTGWTITPNTVNGVTGHAFPGENAGLHQGGASWSWKVASGWYSLSDNCTFFFYEALADVNLNIAIDDAQMRLSATTVGTSKGQTPQSAVDTYQTSINTAKNTLGSTDATAIQNAIDALAAATTVFVNAAIPLVTSSTSASPVWYLIKNTTRGGKGATLYTTTFNGQLKNTTAANQVAADGTSTGAAAPTLNHLFRFEKLSDGTYKIVNAAMPQGELLQAAAGGNSSNAIKYGTPESTKWKLQLIGYNATLVVDEIKFVSAGNGTVWHADGGNNLVSYEGGTASASAWYTEAYTGDLSPLFKVGLTTKINEANQLYNATTSGTRFAQAPAASRTTLADAITVAQTINNDPTTANEAYLPAAITLDAAIIAYKQSIIKALTALQSANADNYSWYWIQSTATHTYVKDYVISAGIRAVGEKFTYEIKGEEPEDKQLFRFELNTEGTAVLNIINKTGTYMASNGAIATESTIGNTFAINQLSDGYSFNIKPSAVSALHAQNTGAHIVNYAGDTGSASAWTMVYAMETPKVVTGNRELNAQYTIRTENKVIKVDGVENFEVYSLSGQKVNHNNQLNNGVYIIKINDFVEKVIVK